MSSMSISTKRPNDFGISIPCRTCAIWKLSCAASVLGSRDVCALKQEARPTAFNHITAATAVSATLRVRHAAVIPSLLAIVPRAHNLVLLHSPLGLRLPAALQDFVKDLVRLGHAELVARTLF